MKIVVGGATGVGKSIVGYLSLGDNDIVVVDEDSENLNEMAKEYDVQPVLGSISRPDIQESIDMKNMDMLIAVTDSDEVNMVACQVAYSLFNVPRKIARVDSQYFLNPLWNTLYNEKSLPIDLIITPDIEIAKFIDNLLNLPGSTAVFPFMNDAVNVFSFRLQTNDIPFMKFSLSHINQKLEEMSAQIVLIMRGNRRVLPRKEEETRLQRNDIIYISCFSEQNTEIMRLFGVDHNPYEKIVIFGGNAISYYLASQIEKNENISSCRIIEDDADEAAKLAERLNSTAVITGEMMSDIILQDAGFASADVSVAVTERDKDNMLLALLASRNRDTQAISLINSKDYGLLSANLRDNVNIDRSVITISAILKYLRKARIREAYSIGQGMGEIWEIRLGDDSVNLGKTVADLNIPESSSVMLIARGEELIYNYNNIRLTADDKLLVYVTPINIRRIESIFYL